MIRNFHVLYVGQIELENIGLAGTPANERRYSNERLREAFATARDIAQHMDRLGYDVLWTAEHHFQREGYECLPNLIQLGLWLATQTERLKFGCAFNVLPMWHPIRLAEDYAMADIVTDGRVIMGVGRGYHSREVETFGAPVLDNAANKELFEEQMERRKLELVTRARQANRANARPDRKNRECRDGVETCTGSKPGKSPADRAGTRQCAPAATSRVSPRRRASFQASCR